MWFKRMLIEKESPEEYGYEKIKYNLTESSVTDCNLDELNVNLGNLSIAYGNHSGEPELRELIAQEYDGLSADQVLITSGAAAALFIVAVSLLKPGDHIIVAHPNYASNIEVPRSLGCKVDFLNLRFEENFKLNLDELEDLITPETKIVSLTYPNNPTGTMISAETLERVIEIVESHNCHLLFDETYREMTFGHKLPTAASLSPKAISVESLSKSYGLPGIRIGWLATKDKSLKELLLAAKEQISICNSIVDEKIALSVLKRKDKFMNNIKQNIQAKFKIITAWMDTQRDLKWIQPEGGVVCFPKIKSDININLNDFYQILNEKYKTFVGPGRWFEMDDKYFRIGYGWPLEENLEIGLKNITRAFQDTKQ
ncbi:aminotransferase class I/II-fold pyridoxal phosphate-dependent enzyme [Candidatus Aerophobetes bacterium]|nr:aminotransferase class I/II-fold pyridoxal phosphate-dependent enzyme [Candidatus Aerophobetes bacterium]